MQQRTEIITFRGVELKVTGDYSRGRPARMYMRNGDPGYPEEPDEFTIESVFIGEEDATDLLDSMLDDIATKVLEEMKDVEDEMEDDY